mgnify:CR=1 FL=1
MGRFVPATHDDLAPSGAKARFRANIAAIETARLLVEQADEQDIGSGRGEGPDPGGLGSPLGRRPDGTGLDPRQALAGLSLPGLPSGSTLRVWRDRGIKMGIRNAVPTMPGLGPLLEISYER